MLYLFSVVTLSLIVLTDFARVRRLYKLWVRKGRDPKGFPKALLWYGYKHRNRLLAERINTLGIIVTCMSVLPK